ncbi:hypothetical protein [Leucobacter tenebrionis]|uniref:hypothetical protein n=1 Tax=Leucobacter tenebrionis TaxID=2873270 RepID=UPI001CA60F3D|nr:hypothetical protein [Leucobacter tenebrionis]QZY52365.1 hypothetical protein KVY00_02545 [Leucobacter tenebrionis]
MFSLEVSDAPQRAVSFREVLSLVLMLVPFAVALGFLAVHPSVWTEDLASFFSSEGELIRSDPGWIIASLAIVSGILSAAIGLLGLRERWKYHRRIQRGLIASVAAALASIMIGTWTLSAALDRGEDPNTGLAMFATICCMLYGVLCAAISPRDLVDPNASEYEK